MIDLDKEIDRHNTNSLKWDFAEKKGKNKDILPLWVADMDFNLPDIVIDKLKNVLDNKIFGYSEPFDGYYDAIIDWNKKHYNLNLEKKYIINGCSVTFHIATIIRALTNIGDSVIINQPVYYPYMEIIESNDRKLIVSNLINTNGRYTLDFIDIEKKIKDNNVKLYLLCNPHNPVGRAWTLDELTKIVEICNKYNVFIVSDEIHSDFVFNNNHFVSIGNVSKSNYAILTAPTKSFNIPGLHTSYAYIPDSKVLSLFKKELVKNGYSQSNVIGIKALEIVYRYGDEWLNEVKKYIYNNYLFLKGYLEEKLNVKVTELEATYLVWVDFNSYNLEPIKLKRLIEDKANVWLDQGYIFGDAGKGFVRFNIATQRSLLKKALDNIISVFKDL